MFEIIKLPIGQLILMNLANGVNFISKISITVIITDELRLGCDWDKDKPRW